MKSCIYLSNTSHHHGTLFVYISVEQFMSIYHLYRVCTRLYICALMLSVH